MEAMDSQSILAFGNEHLDSPPAIALLIEMMRLLHRGEFTPRGNTNSGELSGLFRPPVTSYVTGYFR